LLAIILSPNIDARVVFGMHKHLTSHFFPISIAGKEICQKFRIFLSSKDKVPALTIIANYMGCLLAREAGLKIIKPQSVIIIRISLIVKEEPSKRNG